MRPVGTGNCPPARNEALSPEMAVRVGSASVRMTPARSMACRVAVTPGHLPAMLVVLNAAPTAENGDVGRVEVDHRRSVTETGVEVDAGAA